MSGARCIGGGDFGEQNLPAARGSPEGGGSPRFHASCRPPTLLEGSLIDARGDSSGLIKDLGPLLAFGEELGLFSPFFW
uniref:Uncharacterized protein n=1 Tax=Chromera velia CCMP2878 TaxID=1169474 RepID=A0A0K6S7A8_9ALVE|eukprot:Cvel_19287.t2-p1 / transcript=Cvel_19287.t2 / gene=Cvel_19287 / organism=Chromera_velia_CCMP2878 / gene_product=hypothetical protein / transcript_product=hypothetical protein / location=Cvel_scaffold1651:28749-29642(+) / protein_length=78 / sequence_SO=supercontig / SO=protein_coding / is_pseudo=false